MKNKRMLKNIIMIIIVVILLGGISFASYKANKNKINKKEISTNGINKNLTDVEKQIEELKEEINKENNNEVKEENTQEEQTEQNTKNKKKEKNKNSEENINQKTITKNYNKKENRSFEKKNNSQKMMGTINHISYIYYVIFGTQSFVMAGVIMYLIMSNFNKKTIKETFKTADKVIIFVLSVSALTSCLTFASHIIAK